MRIPSPRQAAGAIPVVEHTLWNAFVGTAAFVAAFSVYTAAGRASRSCAAMFREYAERLRIARQRHSLADEGDDTTPGAADERPPDRPALD